MRIAVIGAGAVGSAVARAMAGAGHSIMVTAIDDEHARAVADEAGGSVGASNEAATRETHMTVLAVPFQAIDQVTGEIAEAARGKIVMDVTNPLKPDLSGLAVSDRSGAEYVQERLPQASVVKAFNTVLAANQAEPVVDGVQLDGFIAGDDATAKATVVDLLVSLGYHPVDVGGLRAALALEHMALLNISLNARKGLSWRSAWKLIGPVG